MAHSISAKKRVRQNATRRARNRGRKDRIRTEVKGFLTILSSGSIAKAEEQLKKTVRALDQIASKGTIHKNTASRKRSRLARRLNALRASGGKGAAAAKA